MRLSPILLTIAAVLSCSAYAGGGPPENQNKEAAGRAALVAHAAHLNRIPFHTCRFRMTGGQAKSVEEALKGKLFNVSSYECRLVTDGKCDCFVGFAPPPNEARAEKMPGGKIARLALPGYAGRYLGDGSRSINYSPGMKSVNLYSAEKDYREPEPSPLFWMVGHRNPYFTMMQRDPERYVFSVVGFEEVLGRPVITVRFDDKKLMDMPGGPIAVALTYSFDPARGHLPIRHVRLWNGKPITQQYVTHVIDCGNDRWFPERIVKLVTRKDGLFDVGETKTLELDVDHRPKRDEFTIDVPAGTGVLEYGNETGKFFRLKQDEKINIDDLPRLFQMLDEVKVNPRMDTAIRPPYSSWPRWAAGAVGLVLALGGAWYLWRRRTAAAA